MANVQELVEYLAAHGEHKLYVAQDYVSHRGRLLKTVRVQDGVLSELHSDQDPSWDDEEDVTSQFVYCENCNDEGPYIPHQVKVYPFK